MRSKLVRGGAVAALVASLAAIAGSTTASGAPEQRGFTLRIGVVVPFTGASAVFGPAYAKAAGLAVQQAKRALRQAGVTNVRLQIEYADEDPAIRALYAAELAKRGIALRMPPPEPARQE